MIYQLHMDMGWYGFLRFIQDMFFLQKIGEEHDVMGYPIAGQSHITQGVGLFWIS